MENRTAAIIFPHNKMAQKITEQRDSAPLIIDNFTYYCLGSTKGAQRVC